MSKTTRDEDLKVGQAVRFLGQWLTITGFRPYTGPHSFVFGLADVAQNRTGFSLTRGGSGWETDREVDGPCAAEVLGVERRELTAEEIGSA